MHIIRNASIVNENKIFVGDVLIKNGRIEKIGTDIGTAHAVKEIDATGLHLFPGCIDDQVHFREPGLTHKADLFTESRAPVAGGVTSFMEMPNTVPNTLTQELLEEKYRLGAARSIANFSFFMGVANDNVEEVLALDIPRDVYFHPDIRRHLQFKSESADDILSFEIVFKTKRVRWKSYPFLVVLDFLKRFSPFFLSARECGCGHI